MKDFSTWLKQTLASRNIKPSELSYRSGVSDSQISRILNKKSKPSAVLLKKIAIPLRVTEEEILRAAGVLPPDPPDQDTIKIPVLGIAPAGDINYLIETNEFIELDARVVGEKNVFALHVTGNCLIDERIFHGDTIIVSRSAPVKNGNIAVVRIDEEVTCKKVFLLEDKRLLLESANKDDPWKKIISPKEKEIDIIGKVVGTYRRFS